MPQRLSQPSLQRYHRALRNVIADIHDARVRYSRTCGNLKPRILAGTSSLLKELLAMPHDTDLSNYEVQLKRRLVRIAHRIDGLHRGEHDARFSLRKTLPTTYQHTLIRYDEAASELLRRLADVDIKTHHEHLQSPPLHVA